MGPLEDELEVVRLEDALAAAKASGDVPRDLKERLRAARAQMRTSRTYGTVNPDVVSSISSMNGEG